MGREWDRKRKIDELLNNGSSITPEVKKQLEEERGKLKIQLKRKQARNRHNRLSRNQNIVVSVVPPAISTGGSVGQQPITFTVSINGKPASTVNM
jgi:hypothetical protein